MIARLIGIAVIASLTLSGCSVVVDAVKPRPTPPPSLDETSVYQQQLEWNGCGENLECASVWAPANWLDFSEGLISLQIARDPAGAGLPPLFVNPGGPGVSGSGWLDLSYAGVGTIDLRRNYQLMAFDPRGTGESTPVTCGGKELKDELLYSVSPHAYGSPADLARSEALLSEFAASCLTGTAIDPALLNTQQAARDLDLWRQLLGREQLDYLGYSYGTELGATYAAMFPERVGRMVLDGAVDVTLTPEQLLLSQLDGFERAFRAYLTDCLNQAECPFYGSVEDATVQAATLLESLDQNPAPSQDGRELSIGSGLTGVIAALYSDLSWPYLSTAFEQLVEGDGSVMLLLADFYNDRGENGYTSNLFEANLAISCADSRISDDPQLVEALNDEITAASPLFGRFFTNPQLGCQGWPAARGLVELDYTQPLANAPLIVGTTGDPATPYQGAVALHELFDRSHLLTYEGEGHTAYAGNSTCVDTVVDDYLLGVGNFDPATESARKTTFLCK